MEGGCTPRVNGSQLRKHIGNNVSLVGKTKLGSTSGLRTLQLESSDKQNITLQFRQPLDEPLSQYVEVIGHVGNDLSLSVTKHINWGDDFNLDAYDQLVKLLPQFPSLFTSSQ